MRPNSPCGVRLEGEELREALHQARQRAEATLLQEKAPPARELGSSQCRLSVLRLRWAQVLEELRQLPRASSEARASEVRGVHHACRL
jgi:hypothetical protein